MILKMNRRPNIMKSKRTLILKILTQLKTETKYIQNDGGISTKLYNNFFTYNDIHPDDFIKNERIMQMKHSFYHLRRKIP